MYQDLSIYVSNNTQTTRAYSLQHCVFIYVECTLFIQAFVLNIFWDPPSSLPPNTSRTTLLCMTLTKSLRVYLTYESKG